MCDNLILYHIGFNIYLHLKNTITAYFECIRFYSVILNADCGEKYYIY